MLENPQETHARYVQLVRTHHECWFSQRYGDVLPFLEQRAKQARRSIGKLPAKEVIARATGGFTLRTPAARSVTLVPSYYTAPFVVVVSEGKDVVLVYGTRPREERTGTVVDGQTVKVLKALADETRLHILQLLAHRPLYGQQLAESLGLSHPTVSHHMAQLRIAGLTRTELTEDGTKAYFVRPETVEALCDALRAAFVQPSNAEDEERGAGR
jgi:ArsR family transcriptional regulator